MHTWHWCTWEGSPYLTCSLLKSWSHGFFTHQFWPRSPLELVVILQPEAQVYRVKQVHGNQVLSASAIQAHLEQMSNQAVAEIQSEAATSPLPPADGVLTERENQAAWVCSADCTPVLIADEQTGQVAAVHAGWRGTAAKVVPQAIAALQAQGSQLANLRVAMGPAIAGEVYQVSTEVATQVGTTVVEPEILVKIEQNNSPVPILDFLLQLSHSPVWRDEKPGHVRLDVRRVNALQLEQLGMHAEQIAIAPHCTYQQPEHFFSYRRDRRKQVQWSGIVSRKPA